ncbi:peptidyl-prolyl cis-trans isomerase [Sulfuricaulis limicola]|uniref:Periplasmic chaperone PpiD n=1 Tax=Sulfuricaulis limicola TaxID=1620215 RepID=A0A1B4XH84_9GAMM|nr:SurA N-terminal domain-containing protein [Sulfuricaulis limicola]BAV34165.1 peptidyl-prolyl cis-trans isomerase [Sulfuricaulis limicola]
MLTKIREKTQGIIATFILVLIGVPFALWGVNSYFDTGGKINVARVGDMKISQDEYRRTLDRLRARVEPKAMNDPRFKQSVLDSLISQTLLAHDAENQGYRISDAQLAQILRDQPSFQRDGKFDPALYEALLRREGLSPREFETRVRDDILVTQVQAGISESFVVTQGEIAALARLLAQERELAQAMISAEALMPKATVSGADIEQYYSAHPEMFQFPEQVRVDYLRLSAGDLNQGFQPTEEELKKAYAEEAARYVIPEKRRASHILISLPAQPGEDQSKAALAKIQDIARQARAGGDFGGLAKKYSADSVTAAQGGDLGEVRRGVLPKEVEDAVFALKSGEVSQPVRSPFGYHLVKLTAHTPEKRKAFAEVRKDLVEVLRRRQAEERFFDVAEKFRNLVYEQPDSLAPAAKALGLEIRKSEWFSPAGGTGIAANPKVVQAAFEPDVLSQARNSDAIEISADTLVAVRVAERRPAGRKPLAEVRPGIERTLKQQRALEQAHSLGEAALQELRAGASLEAVARKHGFKYVPSRTLTRRQTGGIDPRIVESAFRAPRPEGGKPVHELVDLGEQGYALLALQGVRDASGKADNATQQQIRALLGTRRGADYYANYREGLRQKAEIKIYSDQL